MHVLCFGDVYNVYLSVAFNTWIIAYGIEITHVRVETNFPEQFPPRLDVVQSSSSGSPQDAARETCLGETRARVGRPLGWRRPHCHFHLLLVIQFSTRSPR